MVKSLVAKVKSKKKPLIAMAVSAIMVVGTCFLAFAEGETATSLSGVVTADMLKGVLDEILALLPVVLPVTIGFISLRKGIAFIQGILHSA